MACPKNLRTTFPQDSSHQRRFFFPSEGWEGGKQNTRTEVGFFVHCVTMLDGRCWEMEFKNWGKVCRYNNDIYSLQIYLKLCEMYLSKWLSQPKTTANIVLWVESWWSCLHSLGRGFTRSCAADCICIGGRKKHFPVSLKVHVQLLIWFSSASWLFWALRHWKSRSHRRHAGWNVPGWEQLAKSKGLLAELPRPMNEDGAARGTTIREPSSYQSIASHGSLSPNKS